MRIRDTGLDYGIVTMLCHWLGALALPAFLALSLAALWGGSEKLATALAAPGLIVMGLFAFRLYWRLSSYQPLPLGDARPVAVLVGRGVALGMLLAGVVLPGMHIWLATAEAPALAVLILYHLGIAAFLGGFALHLYGAYRHQFISRDASLARLFGRKVEL